MDPWCEGFPNCYPLPLIGNFFEHFLPCPAIATSFGTVSGHAHFVWKGIPIKFMIDGALSQLNTKIEILSEFIILLGAVVWIFWSNSFWISINSSWVYLTWALEQSDKFVQIRDDFLCLTIWNRKIQFQVLSPNYLFYFYEDFDQKRIGKCNDMKISNFEAQELLGTPSLVIPVMDLYWERIS